MKVFWYYSQQDIKIKNLRRHKCTNDSFGVVTRRQTTSNGLEATHFD